MKNTKKIIFFLTIFFAFSLQNVKADFNYFGTGDSSYSSGTTGGGMSGCSNENPCDPGPRFNSGTYLFQLTYRDGPNGQNNVVKDDNNNDACAVVYLRNGDLNVTTGANPNRLFHRYYGSQIEWFEKVDKIVKAKAKKIAKEEHCAFITEKKKGLYSLAYTVEHSSVDNIKELSYDSDWKEMINDLGISNYRKLRKPGSNPGSYDSFGYRIFIQRFTCFGTSSSGADSFCGMLAPRKTMANIRSEALLFGDKGYQGDLFTTHDEAGVKRATYQGNFPHPAKVAWRNDVALKFKDMKSGEGFNIIGFNPDLFKNFDYSLDIACENCDSENADNKAMVIQDSTNWEDIKQSGDVPEAGKCGDVDLKNYYKKTNDGTYCREEYHVYYPTTNKTTKKLRALTGRYFTVNAKGEKDLTEQEKNSGVKSLEILEDNILNFAPIKVTKVRQCQGGDLNKYTQNNDISKCSSGDSNGDIKIKYAETKNGGYNYEGTLKTYNCKVDTPKIENGMLTQSRTCSYTLDENVYRYINMSDGKSILKATKDNIDKHLYKDVGVSNLPVSMNNNERVGNAIASVQLEYQLPSCSNIKKVYDNGGNCFNVDKKTGGVDNIYKKYRKNEPVEGDNINNSACVKLYGNSGLGKNNSNVETCISDRQTNKFGDEGKSCIDKNKIGNNDNYVCEINKCESAEEAKALGVDWNEKEKYCCAPGEKYNENTGKCTSKPTPICVGSDCKPTPECVDKDDNMTDCGEQLCNGDTKKCVPDNKCDLLGCGDACCEGADGHAYCGVKMNNQILCAGKPTPINGELGVYRTIDLTNPFTNQSGVVRETGDNWCDYKVGGKECNGDSTSYKNSVVKTVITENDNKTEETAMYKVTLNSDSINAIRKYNKSHNYDDFTLKCDKKGDNCKMQFNKTVYLNVQGDCANTTQSNFESCRG